MKTIITLLAALLSLNVVVAFAGEDIYINDAKRAPRDYGKIMITRTEVNPEGQTKMLFETCLHPRIGKLKGCDGYLYEVLPQGWLNKDTYILFNNGNPDNLTTVLAAGTYYMKLEYGQPGKKYRALGEMTLKPFVTNVLQVELE